MNNILSRKSLSEQQRLWGRDWWYNFRSLPKSFEGKMIAVYLQSIEQKCANQAKNWSEKRNSEWICRNYLAAKMIMAATIQINSLKFALSSNLRMVAPYLRYYVIFSLMRCVIFTLPDQEWRNGSIATMSHQKVLNIISDHLRYLDREWASSICLDIIKLRHERELISYWHPTSGDSEFSETEDLVGLAVILAEIAQFNSEVLERAIKKHADPSAFVFLDDYAETLSQTESIGQMYIDWDDCYRVDYLARKYPVPANISHIMTEGHVDDFLSAWCSEDPQEFQFDPDEDSSVIFDLP